MQRGERTLDPEDWDDFERHATRALRDALGWLRTVRERRPWTPVPAETAARLDEPVPRAPAGLGRAYEDFLRDVLPHPTGNVHPRFWGWVMGTGTPVGLVADLLASAMNAHVAGYDQSAALVERQVLRWLAELFGFPADASGLLVGGGTEANLTALLVARHARAGFDVRALGLAGPERPRLCAYASTETHAWARKAVEVLGLGRDALRLVDVDARFRIRLDELRARIAADRAAGWRPICAIGNAGTVNTGAVDDLEGLAELCAQERLWFHVDGCLGGLAALSPALRPQLRGLERADSLGFDLHKWGYLQYEIGGLLVRDARAHRAAFAAQADYLRADGRGILKQPLEFAALGLGLSRGFRALRAWLAFKAHGVDAIGALIEQNVAQVARLAARVEAHPRLELLAPPSLNVACFRYVRPGLDEPALERLNRELLFRLQEDGVAVPSSTRVRGRFALRVANANHRTRDADFEALVEAAVERGDALGAPAA